MWAPDSKRVAITDYVGSDLSDCKIVDVKTARVSSVTDSLKGSEIESLIAKNHHAFVKCLKWRSATVVEIEVEAYGDANPKGINKRFRFDVATSKIASR